MRKTMTLMLKVVLLILTLHQINSESNILDDTNVKSSLQYLCPGVDICNKNDPNPEANPREIDERGYTSCCHSCSCHTSCYLITNCCFPGGNRDLLNSNTSSTFADGNVLEEQGNSSLPVYRNSSLGMEGNHLEKTNEITRASANATTDIGKEIRTASNVTWAVDKDDEVVANDDVSHERELVVKKCMYARTGIPDKSWPGVVPAYRMVVTPPSGGCKSNTACPLLTLHYNITTCDSEAVYPWGDLFPVYSASHNLIFKNELCACCYGVFDYKPWLAFLKCGDFDFTNKRKIPLSEHLNFLEKTNTLSNHCTVFFNEVNTPAVIENQCFIHTIGTCPFSSDFVFPVPAGINLTKPDIVKACESGPDAPFTFKQFNLVYRNVFCAICNLYLFRDGLQCFSGADKINKFFGKQESIHLLDTSTVQKLTQAGKKEQVSIPPMACLKNNSKWIDDSCRAISCPSGQTRIGGVCEFPSKVWFRERFKVNVKLEYVTSNASILEILTKDEGMNSKDDVAKAFIETNPWPSAWSIITIYHTNENYQFTPHLAVELYTKISQPKVLLAQIKASMRRQWNIKLDGMGITFVQSFLQNYIVEYGKDQYGADWSRFMAEIKSDIQVPDNALTYWEPLWYDHTQIILSRPQVLNKLLICEQISLKKNEYTVTAQGLILINGLTKEILFSMEFDIVEEVDGELVARICLADSPFAYRSERNGAPAVSIIILKLVWIMHILQWAITLSSSAPVLCEFR